MPTSKRSFNMPNQKEPNSINPEAIIRRAYLNPEAIIRRAYFVTWNLQISGTHSKHHKYRQQLCPCFNMPI